MASSSRTAKQKAAAAASTKDAPATTETETETPATTEPEAKEPETTEATPAEENASDAAPADAEASENAPASDQASEDVAPLDAPADSSDEASGLDAFLADPTVSGDTAGVQGNPDPDARPKIAADVAATENPDGSARVGSAPLGWEGGPAAAELAAPKVEVETDEEGRQKLPTTTDAAVESLRIAEQQPRLTDEHGDEVDPDSVFGEPNQWGQRRSQVRLHVHTTATPHERSVTTLFLAKGKTLSKAQAEVVINRIKAQAERA